jgi:predicted ATP-dependent serine protease
MNAYCPECETELDITTGICPACRWDPMVARTVTAQQPETEREMSLTERYRGTRFDVAQQQLAMEGHHSSRGRTFVAVGLVAGVFLYGGVMSAMGMF